MPITSKPTQIVVFSRAPQPGLVKTRLIPRLGDDGAAALQARLVTHTLRTAKRAAFGTVQLHAAPADHPFMQFCAARYGVELVDQCCGDLGQRMRNAFERTLPGGGVLLIGTDCPALTPQHLRRAARSLLAGNDAVLIPVADGGYGLIGLARCDARLFDDIAWSTPTVLHETRQRLHARGWRWTELETLWDVDTPADYDRLMACGLLTLSAGSAHQRAAPGRVMPDTI